jgi:hypothetical protein
MLKKRESASIMILPCFESSQERHQTMMRLVKMNPLAGVVAVIAGTLFLSEKSSSNDISWPSPTSSSLVGSPITVSYCEKNKEEPSTTSSSTSSFDFYSVGVNEEDVDTLVQSLLKDPSVNIPMMPDALEAQLYKSTILLTLNAVYSILGSLQGTRLLSHDLALSIERDGTANSPLSKALMLADDSTTNSRRNVNDKVLHQVAVRLLANPAVNSPWIPDQLEQQIYFACLQVIFRVTQIVLSTFKVTICGHDFTLQLGFDDEEFENLALSAAAAASLDDLSSSSSAAARHQLVTPVDLDLLASIARQAGVDDETNNDYWWNRMFTSSDFVRQLHVSLYGLVLGILDDLFLGQLKLQILSDIIGFDLVPATSTTNNTLILDDVFKDDGESPPCRKGSNSSGEPPSEGVSAAASFAAGVGVGLTLMAVLSSNTQR